MARQSAGHFARPGRRHDAKFGCGQGGCGACTVLIDGDAHLSCLTLAETVEGRSVETLDGLKDGPNLHLLQRAFMEHFAAQCGYCTPGMLMAAKALLDHNSQPPATRWSTPSLATSAAVPDTNLSSTPCSPPPRAAARAPEGTHHAGTAQGHFRRRARRQSQGNRQGHPAPGHARPCHRYVHLFQRPPVTRHAASEGAAQPARPRPHPPHRHRRGRAQPRRTADHSRRGCAAQPQHPAQPDQFRQGRRADAGGGQGALQGRAGGGDRRRQPPRGLRGHGKSPRRL